VKNMIFGAATAAYQIEGAFEADGRGPSVWDRFSHTPGKIKTGETGDIACDHYHRLGEDVEIMKDLSLDAYRFSVSWSRVLPEGTGKVNDKGMDFYDRLVDKLVEAGIDPYVTLFHWDLPTALQDRFGGFASREIIGPYCDYAEGMVKRLGDRVRHWITFNEPWVYGVLGHLFGVHAPGVQNIWTMMKVFHHQLLAHGEALSAIRAAAPGGASGASDASGASELSGASDPSGSELQIGITLNLIPIDPASERSRDKKAAVLADQFVNRLFLDPLLKGRYPKELWKHLWPFRPKVKPGDMDIISRKVDFLGINNYTREHAFHSCRPFVPFNITGIDIPEQEYEQNDVQFTSMGWEVYPEGIYRLLMRIRDEYENIPVYITENGAAFGDLISADGKVRDVKRLQFLESYISSVARAAREGANVKGYFVWSLMDNFEWAEGFAKRFGLVHVDYATGERTIKESGRWYAGMIKEYRSTGALP
jgi:beta-glucosidase